ncbi:glycoside hydrolase family 16 protein [Algoriphagus sp.]|uniref:glycoside hydrolase family 16 protein n=1 Tax=Algoriphagus sp. TaxID=1872435 RepID=UPI0027292C0B|nr:glycoside hydrolase family 16 protein [Algoriphagus sp.]MDO8966154.1 glycoside hydrolase family 16 protein [Algoriphagus sp.]MDP3200934.1 glycoside hydrolase family 16 protein [Algoriphagus sp.]
MRILLISMFVFSFLLNSDSQELDFHDAFLENFQNSKPEFFRYGSTGRKANFKWKSGKKAKETDDSKILSFKIDPREVAGPGKGPEIISNKFTHFGSYATRLKVPDPRGVQPNVGAVVGYFTYHMDKEKGLSEIDFEWLLADPEVIYMGTWTGESGKLKRVGRTINLAKGIIYTTEYREDHTKTREKLTGSSQNLPEKIEAIEGFNASAQFHTYGFDWYPDRIRWWLLHPTTADTVVLWDYKGERGIPQHPSKYRMNFWHTNNWSVETNPKSLEKPKNRFELEVDWMGYRPY